MAYKASQKTVRNLGLSILTLLIAGLSLYGILHAKKLNRQLDDIQEHRVQLLAIDILLADFVDIAAELSTFVIEEQDNIKPLLVKVKDLQVQTTEVQKNLTNQEDQAMMASYLAKLKQYRVSMLAYSKELSIRRTGEGVRSWESTLAEIEGEAHQLIRKIKSRLRSEISSHDQILLQDSKDSLRISMVFGLFGLLGAFAIGIWLRIAMARPVRDLVNVCEAVAGGDLRTEIEHFDRDEIGTLATAVQSMIGSLRHVVGEIKVCSSEIGEATQALEQHAGEINQGAGQQGEETINVSSAISQLDEIINTVNDKVTDLMQSLDESSSSGQEIAVAIRLGSQQADKLADEIESISSAQVQMNHNMAESVIFLNGVLESSKQVSVLAEDLSVTSEQVGQVAQEATILTENVTRMAADRGAKALAETLEVTRENKDLVDNYSRLINSLGQRSAGIGSVLDVISSVADQINLLSLNAAIIAAQAGEHGRGFGVVAQEIRNLSDATSQSVLEIEEQIQGVQLEVKEAVKLIERVLQGADVCINSALQADSLLKEIVESSASSSKIAAQIAESSRRQLSHSKEICATATNNADQVWQIKKMIAEQKLGSDNIVSSVEELRGVSEQLMLGSREQAEQSQIISETLQATHVFSTEIAEAMRAEQDASRTIVTAAAQIASVSQNQVMTMHGFSESVNGLKSLALKLGPEVDRFKLPDTPPPLSDEPPADAEEQDSEISGALNPEV